MTQDEESKRATINIPRKDKEEYIDKAIPRLVARKGAILSQQQALVEVYREWWLLENIRSEFPDEWESLVKKLYDEFENPTDQMPWNLPSAFLEDR